MNGIGAFPIDRLPKVGAAAVSMGVFDGVHRGHLALARATAAAAAEHGVASVALVFDPHPDEVVSPGTIVPRLAPMIDNLRRLELAGIDRALPVRFDAELRALTAEEFLAALAPSIELRALVMTPQSAFGRNRGGTPDAMRARGRAIGFDVVPVQPLVDEHGPISSARVRAALAAGEIDTATTLLGHPPTLVVQVTAERGGWLRFAYSPALPPPGRYRATMGDVAPETVLEVGPAGEVRLEGGLPPSSGSELSIELGSRL
ncbi:MAG TPA: hypothetical protein VKU35_00490 [Candidatus Limnocylindria bacterium]|nr:hypothetical protein [Candidatus Limnocylindria bacterium]